MENPIKMDDLGVPLFSETSICWIVLAISIMRKPRICYQIDLMLVFVSFHGGRMLKRPVVVARVLTMSKLPTLICLFHYLPTSATSVLNSANKKLTDKKKAFLRNKQPLPRCWRWRYNIYNRIWSNHWEFLVTFQWRFISDESESPWFQLQPRGVRCLIPVLEMREKDGGVLERLGLDENSLGRGTYTFGYMGTLWGPVTCVPTVCWKLFGKVRRIT